MSMVYEKIEAAGRAYKKKSMMHEGCRGSAAAYDTQFINQKINTYGYEHR